MDTQIRKIKIVLVLSSLLFLLVGCGGTRTFHELARAGDTVALAAGWKKFTKDNITVTITSATGDSIVYYPGDPAIRAVLNLYPDPVSSLVVSELTGQDLTPNARTYAYMVNEVFTGYDRDWYQSSVFIDLPVSLSVGPATIDIVSSQGETASSTLDIVDGAGQPNSFSAVLNGPLTPYQLAVLGRVEHFVVSFSGDSVPQALQLELTHDPDASLGGQGVAHVTNPRGDLKNVAWSDDGTNLRVVLTPAKLTGIETLNDCKFYVAGGIANLALVSLQAVDADGNPIDTVTASVD